MLLEATYDRNQCHRTPAPVPSLLPPPLQIRPEQPSLPQSMHFKEAHGEEICSLRGRAGLLAQRWQPLGDRPFAEQTPRSPSSLAARTCSKSTGNGGPLALAPKCGPHTGLRKLDLFRPDPVEPRRSRPCPWPAGYSSPGCPRPACPTSSSPCRGLDWGCCTLRSQAANRAGLCAAGRDPCIPGDWSGT